MTTRAPSARSIGAALVFALSVFGFTLFAWKSFGGSAPLEPKGYRITVSFGAGGAQLFPNADVRIAGVRVGKVRTVEPAGLRTAAGIELEPRFAPLRADARAILRTKTLLGETFVELAPGSRGARALREGETLARAQVADVQGVEEVLATFDVPTRKAFRELLVSLADALDGRAGDLNATIGSLGPTAEQLRRLLETLGTRDRELRALVRDGGTTLRAIGGRETALRRLVTAGERVLSATASRDRELTQIVRTLPSVLREARATLTEAEGAAADAAPVLRGLRPAAPLVQPALRETRRLIPQVARLSSGLRPVIDRAKRGLPAVTRVVATAQPLLRTLDTAGRDLVPVVEALDVFTPDVVAAAAKLAAATQGQVDGHHYLRVLFLLFNESFVGYERKLASSRSNPYPRPGAMGEMLAGGLASLDCSTARNPQTIPVIGAHGAPPCKEQGPWTLRGRTAIVPLLRRDPP